MESINILIDDDNDFFGVSEEDAIVNLIEEVKIQVHSDRVTLDVVTPIV